MAIKYWLWERVRENCQRDDSWKQLIDNYYMRYDYLIVGAGLAGSILAYRARKAGKSVFVADTLRRWQLKPQITMYDFIDIAPIDWDVCR